VVLYLNECTYRFFDDLLVGGIILVFEPYSREKNPRRTPEGDKYTDGVEKLRIYTEIAVCLEI